MRDARYEDAIKRAQLTFRYVTDIPLTQIKVTPEARLQIRLDPGKKAIDEDLVVAYAIAMERGDQFPAIVLYLISKSEYGVITGLQRIAAAELAKRATFDAYVVDIQPNEARPLSWLRRDLQHVEGKRPSAEESLFHAAQATWDGMQIEDASKRYGVKPSRLSRFLRYRKGVERIPVESGLGAKIVESMAEVTVIEIDRIPSPELKGGAARLVHRARLGSDAVKALVHDMIGAKTEAGQRAVLVRAEQDHAERIHLLGGIKGRVTTPYMTMKKAGDAFARELRKAAELQPINNDERKQEVRFLEDLIRKLQQRVSLLKRVGEKAGVGKRVAARVIEHGAGI